MRHSHPCSAERVRCGVLREASPACSVSHKVAEQVAAELVSYACNKSET